MTTYKILTIIRSKLVNKLAELHEYKDSWGPEYSIKCMEELYTSLTKQEASQVNLHDLSVQELKDLGFQKWDKPVDAKVLWLAPIWMKPFIADGTPVVGIGGEIHRYDVRHEDNDHRFGALAFGVIKEDV